MNRMAWIGGKVTLSIFPQGFCIAIPKAVQLVPPALSLGSKPCLDVGRICYAIAGLIEERFKKPDGRSLPHIGITFCMPPFHDCEDTIKPF